MKHEKVCETANCWYPHTIKGNGVYAFVICHHQAEDEESLRQEINELVSKIVGPIAKSR